MGLKYYPPVLHKAIIFAVLAAACGHALAQWQVDAERGHDAIGFGLLVYCAVAFLDIRQQWRISQGRGLARMAIWGAGLVVAAFVPLVLWLIVVIFGGMMLCVIIKDAFNR